MPPVSTLPPSSGVRLRLLLVEDSAPLRRSMARALKRHFNVFEATDGQAAVELVRAHADRGEAFDVLVTDLEMPNLNGKEALAEISKIAPDLAQRSIVVTGGAKDKALAAWLKTLPPERVIVKPADSAELHAAIYRLIG